VDTKKIFSNFILIALIVVCMAACADISAPGAVETVPETKELELASTSTVLAAPTSESLSTAGPPPLEKPQGIPDDSQETTIQSTHTPNPYITPTPYFNSVYPPDYNPLTGLKVVYPENLLRSPLMVKISNYPRDIRPQAGLSKADIVFEYYIGAFMNRFLAIFYGENAEWAGPIRSGRLIDGQLAVNYHSALVYGGADERVNEILKSPDVLGDKGVDTRVYEKCPPLCGTETHSLDGLYVNTAGMSQDLFADGYDAQMRPLQLETMAFSDILPESGRWQPGQEVEIIISELCRSRWIFNEENGDYYRWEEEGDNLDTYIPTYDLLSPETQISVENVVILFSDYVVYDMMLHDIRIHYADGWMPAVFFRDGQKISGYWSGLAKDEPLHFIMENEIEYKLAPGKSWIVFVTENSVFQQMTEIAWRLEFSTP
jgi:hypothetical protein